MIATTSHRLAEIHARSAGGGGTPSPPAANAESKPNRDALPGDHLAHDHGKNENHGASVVGEPSSPPPAIHGTESTARARVGERLALWDIYQGVVTGLAETVTDIEVSRIAIENRIGAINRFHGRESDERVPSPETDDLWAIADEIRAAEDKAVKKLEKAMKAHPLGPWMKATKGVGFKQGARLLAAVGNPYWNDRDGRPRRGPAELWAYCGFSVLPASHAMLDAQKSPAGGQSLAPDQCRADAQSGGVGGDPSHPTDHRPPDAQIRNVGGVAQRRRKGVRANWNMQAQSRAYNIADSCVRAKRTSPYGPLYEQAKAHYATSIHHEDCAQCSSCGTCGGLLGKTKKEHLAATGCAKRKVAPAFAGTQVTPSHADKRARRKIAKEVLKDLFLQAKAWHLAPDQCTADAQRSSVGDGVPTTEKRAS